METAKEKAIEHCKENKLVVPFFSKKVNKVVGEALDIAITQARKGYISREMYEEAIAVNRSEVFDEMNKHMNEVMKGMVKIEDVEKILKKLSWTQNGKGEFFCMKKEHKTTCATCVQETLIKGN